ncbi:hypothetical protein [Polyangium spumosum]|uniref:Uncharacterized protein n=1 Tax=Polyangium spumosum TaxID=889282 RepID=A0A6N7Q0J5_9BACT|nr:hypothetical protein [Polyangium spumosum]MRG95804.1 hypothetical protein [Polyangium spumosum]
MTVASSPARALQKTQGWVSYRHEGLSAWYLNGPLGLEQGSELDDADGDGRGEVVRLVDAEGRVALTYADLFVK